MSAPIRIATRSSKLALWQAHHVKDLIQNLESGFQVEIVHVKTIGDRNQTDSLREFGGTGVFTKEVQNSVLASETDLAVHSLKDLPTLEDSGLALAGIPDRAPRFDALLRPDGNPLVSLADLPEGSRVGTGSPRRQAQLLSVRPDLQMSEIRGNVDTRIRKLDAGDYDAIVLAEAGLRRLGLEDRISLLLQPPDVFPAVGQGALGLECRPDDARTMDVLHQLTNPQVRAAVQAERSLLASLRAGCHAPLGAYCSEGSDGGLTLEAVLLSPDGTRRMSAMSTTTTETPESLGQAVAQQLLDSGGADLLNL